MIERGRGRGSGRGGTNMNMMAQRLGTTSASLRNMGSLKFDPEPTYPDFLIPRPTKLTLDETTMVKYYKNIRNKILEETPFYITTTKRPLEDEDDGIELFPPRMLIVGIIRYRDKYKPVKMYRQTLYGFPTGMFMY
jgi:hypothetical protein